MVTLDAPPSYDDARSPIDLTLATDSSGKDILITIKPPIAPAVTAPLDEKDEKEEKVELKAKRAPVDFVLTIDVSGSMATEAPVPGDNERTGLTVLDVVKHAAKTIITTMKSEDRVAIVSFTGQAKVVLPLTATDEEGKTMALKKVDELRPLDSTNLWDGLKQSMNILVGAAAADPEAPRSTVRSLVAAGNAIAAGIANIAVGTSSSEPRESNHRLASIFLLTDGLPNVEPPRGHIPMLKLYLDSQPKEKTKFTINTFGFGYTLDSKLLNDIAKIGNGHFGFIPDSGMVGTNFVHAVANTYATYAEGLYVDIEVDDDRAVKGLQVLGDFETTKASWGVQVPLGQLQYGQTRDLVIRLPASLSKSPVTVTARCRPWNSNDEIKTSRVISDSYIPAPESATDSNLLYHTFRLNFVSAAHKEVSSTPNNTSKGYVQQIDVPPNMATAFKDLASSIKAAFPGEKPAGPSAEADALDLAEDISGQVLEGIETKQSFNRWGLHYLLSLTRSHLRQQCGNFKDPGLQPYGRDSTLFKTMRDEIDTTFDNLPPPKPSSSSPRPTGASYGSLGSPGAVSSRRSMRGGMPAGAAPAPSQMAPTAQSASFSMSRYNKRSAPCFAGSSLIELSTGEKFRVDELSVGASVKTPTGGAAVIGIVRTSSTDESFDLCELGEGLLITPWHPVYVAADKQWRFPADIVAPKQLPCGAVYSLILEESDDSDAHAVYIGGIRCVTMGHGVVDPADVRAHPFLSNHASVMRVLKANPEFTSGTVNSFGTTKDSETGLMCGFVWKEDTPYAVASPSIARDLMQVEPRSITIQA